MKIKNSIKAYFLFSKRLLRKKSFVAILLLVPLLVGALGIAVASGDSGVMTVALAMEDGKDPIAVNIVEELSENDGLIRFIRCGSVADAIRSVEGGRAEAAWIFHGGLEEKIESFLQHTHVHNAFVTVIQREENVFLRLTQEKLNSALYPWLSMGLFSDRANNAVSVLTDEELERIYQSVNAEGEDLFEFSYIGGSSEDNSEASLLVSPMRGLLAVMIVLGGFAVAMFYTQDEAGGVFDRLYYGRSFSFSITYHATAVVMLGAAVLITLLLTGISVGFFYELLAMALYCAATVAFCVALRLILGDIRIFACLIPLFVIATVVLCPILFIAPKLPVIQYLLPTYYYINAFSSSAYLWYAAIYCIALYSFAYFLHVIRAKMRG